MDGREGLLGRARGNVARDQGEAARPPGQRPSASLPCPVAPAARGHGKLDRTCTAFALSPRWGSCLTRGDETRFERGAGAIGNLAKARPFPRKTQARDGLPRRGRGSKNEEKTMAIRFLTTAPLSFCSPARLLPTAAKSSTVSNRRSPRRRPARVPPRVECPQPSIRSRCSKAISRATRPHRDAAAGQAGVPASPHQEQVLAEPAAGGDAASGQQAADLVAQASDMAQRATRQAACRKWRRQRIFSVSTRQKARYQEARPGWQPRALAIISARARVIAAVFCCRTFIPARRMSGSPRAASDEAGFPSASPLRPCRGQGR